MQSLLEYKTKVDIRAAKSMHRVLKNKNDTSNKALEKKIFVKSPDTVLSEIRIAQMHEIFQASLCVDKHRHEAKKVWQLF